MYRVLIVDDYEYIRLDLKRQKVWGDSSGFIIAGEAEDGSDALEKLKTRKYDLVITDMKMPVINGIELTGRIQEDKLCPCVVLLSDYTDFKTVRQSFLNGALDYLSKPVNEADLARVLKRVYKLLEDKRKNFDIFYPSSYIKQIIEYISIGNLMAAETTAKMVDTVSSALKENPAGIRLVLKNALSEIIDTAIRSHTWLEYYIDAASIKNTDILMHAEISGLKSAVSGIIEQLVFIINKLAHISDSNILIKQLCRYVINNIDGEISVKSLSEKLYISKTYLSDMFKKKTGTSLTEYLTMVKMERAKKLLLEDGLKIFEIAERLGYKDIEYFSRLFKKHTGVSPNFFRV